MINQAKDWQQKSLNLSDLCRRVWPAKLTNHSMRTNLEIVLCTGNTPKKSRRKNLIIVPLENVSINLKLWDYIKYGLISRGESLKKLIRQNLFFYLPPH